MKFIDYEHRKVSEELHLSQELRNKSIILMNSVHFYYEEYEKLPDLLTDLDCTPHGECAVAARDSVFYIAYQGEWILIQPYLISNNIKYHCKATFLDRRDPRFHHCVEINKSEIPKSIRDLVAK